MRIHKIAAVILASILFVASGTAQRADVTITLDERFFDTLLDAVFQNGGVPEFAIASKDARARARGLGPSLPGTSYTQPTACGDSVKLLRETNGTRTAVKFREGKIYAPLAFSGSYAPPFVGCVEFSGLADTTIDLEFDAANQRLVARATVANVALNGAGGVGGTVIAKMIQSVIDKKVNPIEIMKLEKISFTVPIQNSGSMRMKAVAVRNEVINGGVNVRITYEFLKA